MQDSRPFRVVAIFLAVRAPISDTHIPCRSIPLQSLLRATHWDGRLLLAGAEVSHDHPGYLEGALLSAERSVAALMP